MNEFKLPEKWCVKVTDESREVLNKWKKEQKYKNTITNKEFFVVEDGGAYATKYWKDDRTEITFEQFKTYVLKEEFNVGDWVTFDSIKDNCKYTSKIKDWNYGSYCILENGTEPFKHIIRKATQEEIDTVTKKEYTIEDLSNGKCAVINDGTLEELRLVLKAAFPNQKSQTSGTFKYYRKGDMINSNWVGNDEKVLVGEQSVKTFLKQINMENKEIIGYKLIKPEYHTACNAILGSLYLIKDESGIYFYQGSVQYNIFNKAGVLNLWFEPVYKETSKIFKMQSASGVFELEVSSKGIYYKLESVFLNISNIELLLKTAQGGKLAISTDRSMAYNIKFNKVDVGCKKDTLISEWEQVYNYYKSLV